ncbi:MAG TPA: tRNA (adenosine(37)-N6)-threonylcarbamoyltransferase complex ATPase subunit type 1 TsaE [Anaeromyxobacteraceae bacterium]|nr:tRNA (adenosine(37)-N6)-threonylcarbamoyltransferase complex ATPase subunit type 1 TsaE [Anaeromyxobacteraceae bacterium]
MVMDEGARLALRRLSRSARQTTSLGKRLGRLLAPGDVVALVGDLGAGKTHLARGICEGAGVASRDVASPSFAIVATYRGRLPLHHADLYRVGDFDELYATGFTDLPGGDGALVVEWADRVPGALPAERLEIELAHDPRRPSVRHLRIVGTGARHAALARALGRPTLRVRGARRPARPSARGKGRRKT